MLLQFEGKMTETNRKIIIRMRLDFTTLFLLRLKRYNIDCRFKRTAALNFTPAVDTQKASLLRKNKHHRR